MKQNTSVVMGKENINIGEWDCIEFLQFGRYPVRDKKGRLKPFIEWKSARNVEGVAFQQGEGYHFETQDVEMVKGYYVMFEIIDYSGKRHPTEMVEIK